MNRIVRLARFETIFENTKRPSRAKFRAMFAGFGFTDTEFTAWADGREWSE